MDRASAGLRAQGSVTAVSPVALFLCQEMCSKHHGLFLVLGKITSKAR